MSRKEIHLDRNTIHCRQSGKFIIVHSEFHAQTTSEGDWIYEVSEIALNSQNIYKIFCDTNDIRIYYTHGDSNDAIDVIDDFNEVLEVINKITSKVINENSQTT